MSKQSVIDHVVISRAELLCKPTPIVSPADTNAAVLQLFDKHRELTSLPVVDGTRTLGLIKRHEFQSEMAKPFRKELHERKSCIAFMDAQPLIVQADTTVEETARLVVEGNEKALSDGFIVERDHRFLGVGLGLDLMRTVADLQQAKNRQIMQSIDYASLIQRAMLRTSLETLQAALPDARIVWEPRDTVGGDFFLCAKFDSGVFIAIADCTGHGVPGAFMTLISSSWLSQALERDGPGDPAQLLGTLNHKIKQSLSQVDRRERGEQSDDGLDALFLWLNQRDHTLTYAGARVPLHVLRAGTDTAVSHETDRMGVGYVSTPIEHRWKNHSLSLETGDQLYVASDGLTDQIGGDRRIAFGKRRLRELIAAHRDLSIPAQAEAFMDAHRHYQLWQRRRDDVTMFCMAYAGAAQ